MKYLPGRCDACGFVVLVPHAAPSARDRSCPKCDAEVSIFPGAKHHDEERSVFEALSELVHASTTPSGAALVLGDIEDLDEEAPAVILHAISVRFPVLSKPLEAARSETTAGRLVPMLLTMLRARSSVRMRSGFEPRRATARQEDVAENLVVNAPSRSAR